MDAQVAPFAHRIGIAALERLIVEAIGRFMPDQAAEEAARPRTVGTSASTTSRSPSAAPARSLASSTSLTHSTSTPPSLRVQLGSGIDGLPRRTPLHRRRPAATSSPSTSTPQPPRTSTPAGRQRQAASGGAARAPLRHSDHREQRLGVKRAGGEPARDRHRRPDPHGAPTRTPRGRQAGDRPQRAHPRRGLRSPRPAPRASHPARPHLRVPVVHRISRKMDADHVIPYAEGGTTSSDNIAPLCRRHHRLKTHSAWTYTMLEPGSFLWSSPHGYQFLRDHHGTPRRQPRPTTARAGSAGRTWSLGAARCSTTWCPVAAAPAVRRLSSATWLARRSLRSLLDHRGVCCLLDHLQVRATSAAGGVPRRSLRLAPATTGVSGRCATYTVRRTPARDRRGSTARFARSSTAGVSGVCSTTCGEGSRRADPRFETLAIVRSSPCLVSV